MRSLENPYNIVNDSRYQIKLISLVSLGMFLFVLFFEPFNYYIENSENQLIFALGLSAITFLILLLFRILLPASVTTRIRVDSFKITNEVGLILLIWLFVAVANIFYIHYVGRLKLTLFIAVKITMFSAFPSVILKLADVNTMLREQLRHYVRRIMKLEQDLSLAGDLPSDPITLKSEAQNDNVEVRPEDLILIKSADNYVEIFYRENNSTRQKLIRNTMKSIQQQLKHYPEFLRCHRTWIVNSSFIINLTNSYKGHRLRILDFDEEIPVSRQYLLSIRDALNAD